jgi:hypothetical protein
MCDYAAPKNEAVNREGNCWLEAKALEKSDNLFCRYSTGIYQDICWDISIVHQRGSLGRGVLCSKDGSSYR